MNRGGPERDLERYPSRGDHEARDRQVQVLEQHTQRKHHYAE
jgi:hypothetical protein